MCEDPAAAPEVLGSILEWAEELAEEPFTTSHAIGDSAARTVLEQRGYAPDPSEPFGIYLQQPLPAPSAPPLDGYLFTTMAELNDVDVRAEAHRVGWPASTRSSDD